MMAIGSIYAMQCYTKHVQFLWQPKKSLLNELDVNEKYIRGSNYHKNFINSFVEMLTAKFAKSNENNRNQILHKTRSNKYVPYQELFSEIEY